MRIWILTAALCLSLTAAGSVCAEELLMGSLVDGVRQARAWQHAGDVALANGELEAAHLFYQKVARIFPGTPHGRLAQTQLKMLEVRLGEPQESPALESWETCKKEIIEFFTWP